MREKAEMLSGTAIILMFPSLCAIVDGLVELQGHELTTLPPGIFAYAVVYARMSIL
jgi:hypothetical protein